MSSVGYGSSLVIFVSIPMQGRRPSHARHRAEALLFKISHVHTISHSHLDACRDKNAFGWECQHSAGRPGHVTCAGCNKWARFPFDSNLIQNKSPARRTLYLIVSVMQSFEATCWLPKQNTNNTRTILSTLVRH